MIGQTLAQYRIVEKIGGGGMGVVYLARDTKLERAVALKFLPPQWCQDDGAKQRFLREAQAASATNHRNICIIHDIEQTADGQLFIVMAYYEGRTLKERLEQGAVPAADAIEIAAEVAEGLAKAHSQGVVHRDIKPGNIILTEDGVKILDFGLAKLADAALKLTLEGSTLGTVAYMSPEQARGEEADERSDIWALGVVLYEMLTGDLPFKGAYPEAVFYAIKNETPAPLGRVEREMPEGVERIVQRALEKDPAVRYQSARELARELWHLQGRSLPLDLRTEPLPSMEGKGLAAAREGNERRARRLSIRLATAVVATIALVALGAYAWLARPLPRTPIAIVPVANHTGEPELDAYRLALTESLISELSDSPNLRVVSYRRLLEPLRRHLTGSSDISGREAIAALAKSTAAELLIVPSLSYRTGEWRARAEIRTAQTGTSTATVEVDPIASSLPKEATQRLMQSLAARIQEQFPVRWPHRRALTVGGSRFRSVEAARVFETGISSYEQLEYGSALASFKQLVEIDPQRSLAHTWLSRTALVMGDLKGAEASGRRAMQLVASDTPRRDAMLAAAALAEGQNDAAVAEQRYSELAESRDDPADLTERADFLKRRGRNAHAVEAFHQLLKLDREQARAHVELCQLYVRLDDYPLANTHAQAALNGYRGSGNRNGEAQALLCLADIQRAQGGSHLFEAQRNAGAARSIFESMGHRYGLSRAYQYLGTVAGIAGDFLAAARFFEEAVTRGREVGNRQIESLALMNLGVANDSLGRRGQALKYFREARDLYSQIGDERRAAEQEINAANLLVLSGSREQRAELLRRVERARSTLQSLGALEFDVSGLQVEAVSSLYGGNHAEAERILRSALTLAKERQFNSRIVSLTVKLAESAFLQGDYERARTLYTDAATTEVGRNSTSPQIGLARVYARYGDFKTALAYVDAAISSVERTKQLQQAPSAYLVRGEIASLSGNQREAREYFARSSALWNDEFPDGASVEARCKLGLMEALNGKTSEGRRLVSEGLAQAIRMGRRSIEHECRVNLAQMDIADRQFTRAADMLDDMLRNSSAAVAPELRGTAHYLLGRVLAARGNHTAAIAETSNAKKLVEQVRVSLPAAYRDRFADRSDIRQIAGN